MIATLLEAILTVVCFVLIIIIMHVMVRCGIQEIMEAVKPVEDEPEDLEELCHVADAKDMQEVGR